MLVVVPSKLSRFFDRSIFRNVVLDEFHTKTCDFLSVTFPPVKKRARAFSTFYLSICIYEIRQRDQLVLIDGEYFEIGVKHEHLYGRAQMIQKIVHDTLNSAGYSKLFVLFFFSFFFYFARTFRIIIPAG